MWKLQSTLNIRPGVRQHGNKLWKLQFTLNNKARREAHTEINAFKYLKIKRLNSL